jgi:SAM-dependent methyltransferase
MGPKAFFTSPSRLDVSCKYMRPLLILIIIVLCACATRSTKNGIVHRELTRSELKHFDEEVSKYGLKDGDTLLDIGSGFGYEDGQLFQYYPNMYFVLEDIDPKYSKANWDGFVTVNGKIKTFKENCKYVIGTADSIPLSNLSHKLVLCRSSIHEFQFPAKMMKEINRIITNDGTLIIVEAIPKAAGDIDPSCGRRRLTKEELVGLCSENGFQLISSDTTTSIIKSKNSRNANILKFKKNTSS